MKTIQKKLKSKTGSSMFLAIVFFMFCFFVGGSVLAAATANGGRLAALKRDRSAYYLQRNAAVVIQNQLVGARPDEKPQINITRVYSQKMTATNPQKASDLRPTGSAWTTISVTTTNCSTELQRFVCETVVKAYLDDGVSIKYDETQKTSGDLADTSGSLSITVPGGGSSAGTTMTAAYKSTCDFSNLDEFGNILFTTIGADGKDGQFQVAVSAHVYKNVSTGSRDATYNSRTKVYTMTQDQTTSYTVTLENAVVGKNVPQSEQGG